MPARPRAGRTTPDRDPAPAAARDQGWLRRGECWDPTRSGTLHDRAYSKDAAGSVEGLEAPNGQPIGPRYSYDPYGSQQNLESGLDRAAQANPFRFQGHYYDAAQQSYDMQARAYLPELGRFLQEDHYEAAGGEFALEADPQTQDRYAFLGGNPTSLIEFDGHEPAEGSYKNNPDRDNPYGGRSDRNINEDYNFAVRHLVGLPRRVAG